MPDAVSSDKFNQAIAEFNEQGGRRDGSRVVPCLASGLAVIRDGLFPRLHQDVEEYIGMDSMRVPVSETRTMEKTLAEISLYQSAEAGAAAADYRYVRGTRQWFAEWLVRLLTGKKDLESEIQVRLEQYEAETSEERRHSFLDALAHILPESCQAPLVLFRLLPLGIRIAVANAFGDRQRSAELRKQQIALLPAIGDCHHCHGRVMECIEQCPSCGNPVWKYEWLCTAD
jgi:hypothetical protein